jgi:hypothetical protein
MCSALADVRFGPKADIWHCSKFGEDKQRPQEAGRDLVSTTNNARDERDQWVAASASGNFDANLAIRERS